MFGFYSRFFSLKSIEFYFMKTESKELLQKWREENARNSELVRQIWLTKDLGSYLGDESMYYPMILGSF